MHVLKYVVTSLSADTPTKPRATPPFKKECTISATGSKKRWWVSTVYIAVCVATLSVGNAYLSCSSVT